jgi:hypothetical protein
MITSGVASVVGKSGIPTGWWMISGVFIGKLKVWG